MFAANEQIILLFEQGGMSPEQIAEDQGADLLSIKAALMQGSAKYRKDVKAGVPDLDFSDTDLQLANKVISNLMQFSEDDNLRLRAAQYIRDDKKGRLDVVKAMSGLNVNINLFQEQLKRANASLVNTEEMRPNIEAKKPTSLMSTMKDNFNKHLAPKIPTASVLEMEPA